MGLVGAFLNGISQGAFFVALGIYGSLIGLNGSQIGMLISAMAIGGMIFQYPLGKLSDLIDRRQVIAGIPLLAIPVIYLLIHLEEPAQHFFTLYILIAILGGLTLPLYSLCMAHMNDYLKPNQMVAASGTLMQALALGMVFGPALGAVSIQLFGPHGLLYLLLTIAIATVMTAFFRLWGGQPRSVSRNAAVAVCANQTPQAAHLIAEGKNT